MFNEALQIRDTEIKILVDSKIDLAIRIFLSREGPFLYPIRALAMRYVIFLYATQQLIPQKVLENYQYTQVGRYYPFWCSEQRGDSSRLPANHSPCHNLSKKFYKTKNNLNASSRSSRIMRSRLVSEIKIFLKVYYIHIHKLCMLFFLICNFSEKLETTNYNLKLVQIFPISVDFSMINYSL